MTPRACGGYRDVKRPRSLFRPVDFPAAVRQDVTIEGHRVDLDVKTHGLAVTPVAVWYAAHVRSRIQPEATPALSGAPVR